MSETWGNMNDDEVEAYVRRNGLDQLIAFAGATSELGLYENIDPANKTPLAAQWRDLVRLHDLVRRRKVTTVLEFGVGKSTLVLAHALAENRREHGDYVTANLRRANPFELHSLDDMQEFIDITAGNLPEPFATGSPFISAAARWRPSTSASARYTRRCPTSAPTSSISMRRASFRSRRGARHLHRPQDRLPMAADLLAIEHFLLPGTLILVDGRTANARFLKCNFQRNWSTATWRTGTCTCSNWSNARSASTTGGRSNIAWAPTGWKRWRIDLGP